MQLMFGSTLGIKIAKNTIYQLIGKAISMAITVSIVLIVTRTYGREGFGFFSLMQTWPALFYVILDFGLNAIATRELSKDWSKVSEYFGNILFIRIIASFVVMLLLILTLNYFPYSLWLKTGIILSLSLILTQALFTSTNIIFQVKLRYDLSVFGYLLGYCVILLLSLYFSFIKADIIWVSFTYVVGGVVTFLINLYFVTKLGVKVNLRPNKAIIKYLIVSSLPLGFMFIFSQINSKADSILLSVLNLPSSFGLNNIETVAVYSLPYKVFEVALVVPTFLMNSVFPVMVNKLEKSYDEMRKIFIKSLKALVLLSITGSILGYIFAPLIIKILGGSEFTQSIIVMRILFLGLIFYFMTQPFAWLIVTLDSQKYLPYIYVVSAIFNFSANYILIPRYSFVASSLITIFSEFLILLMLIYTARKVWNKKYAQN